MVAQGLTTFQGVPARARGADLDHAADVLEGRPLLEGGLLGPVTITAESSGSRRPSS